MRLYAHQSYTVDLMEETNRNMIALPVGLGKSAILLEWARRALGDGRINDMLIICPASLVEKWKCDIEDFAQFEHVSAGDIERMRNAISITSFNKSYQVKKRTIHHRDGTEEEERKYHIPEEYDHRWGAVAIDEAHGIGGHESRQTLTAFVYARLAKYRWELTATPVSGSTSKDAPHDWKKLYGEISFLEPGKWSSWTAWCMKYVKVKGRFNNIIAYHEDDCKNLLAQYAISVDIDDCYDMPEKVDTVVPCKLTEKKVYSDLRQDKFDKYDIDPLGPGVSFGKCMQVCSGHLKTDKGVRMLSTSKEDALKTVLDSTDEPIVIFCNFTASIDICENVCKKLKKSYVIQDGRHGNDAWKRFYDGKADVIILQYQSGGAGLNLQRSHIMVMYEPCYSSILFEQAKGRIHRIGQTNKCQYIYLITPDTIESKVFGCVKNSVDVTEKMIKHWAATNQI